MFPAVRTLTAALFSIENNGSSFLIVLCRFAEANWAFRDLQSADCALLLAMLNAMCVSRLRDFSATKATAVHYTFSV